MRKIKYENNFKKDLKKIKKRGYNLEKLKAVIDMLANDVELPVEYRNHTLNKLLGEIFTSKYSQIMIKDLT